MKRKEKEAEELVQENTDEGYSGLGVRYTEMERSYGATNYYDFVILEVVKIPTYYDISTVVGKCYDALKVGGKLYVDTNETSYLYDRFVTICELFFNPVNEKDGIYVFVKDK